MPTTLTTHRLADPRSLAHPSHADADVQLARSPLVAVAISMAVVGCLIATTPPAQTARLYWLLPLIAVGIEREVRTGTLPWRLGAVVVATHLCFLGVTGFAVAGGLATLATHVAGALFGALLVLSFRRAAFATCGSVFAVAAFGAIFGLSELPALAGIAFAIGFPWARLESARGGRRSSPPVMAALGIAAALHPLLQLISSS